MKRVLMAILALGFSAWVMAAVSPTQVNGAATIDAAAAKALFEKRVVFIDVRADADWDAGRIPGAIHLELKKGFTEATLSGAVAKDKDVVFYCNGETCLRSSEAAAKAVGWGYKKVHYFRDGYPAWKAAGYAVE